VRGAFAGAMKAYRSTYARIDNQNSGFGGFNIGVSGKRKAGNMRVNGSAYATEI
jgi:hypothetical protein